MVGEKLLKPPFAPKEGRISVSDDDLVSLIKQGDVNLYNSLMERYERRVLGFVYRIIGNWGDAEELTQNCFLKAYYALPGYQPSGRFFAWLLTIARNLSKNHLEKKNREMKSLSPKPIPDDVKDSVNSGSRNDEIQEWFSILPEDYKQVMALKYIGDLSCLEIAEMEGISESAVKQRLRRGRDMIRERFEKIKP